MVSVSVVVPCYNYGHLLPACLDSVLSQTGVSTRILIVDDASPDGSGEVARRLAEQDDRVEALVHRVNQKHIATYNEGLEWADGDYTVLLSADDLLTPGSLQRATALMESHSNVGFAYGYSVYFDGSQPLPPVRVARPRNRVWAGEEWIARRCRSATNIISSPEVVVRTSLQRAVGGYRPDLPHSGDLEMWLRLAARMDVGVVTNVDQALYRVHRQSMSRTEFSSAISDLEQRFRAFEVFFDSSSEHLQNPDRLRRQAAQATARRAFWRASRLRVQPDAEAREAAEALAEFALTISPEMIDSAEGRAWRWSSSRRPARWTQLPVALTAVRGRAESWLYWHERRRRCV